MTSPLSPKGREAVFPNLACDPTPENVVETTATCKAELEAAGIEPFVMRFLHEKREVPSDCVGGLDPIGWGFRRAWYYWVAEGPGLPPDYAEALHATHGSSCRVAGHCAAPSPSEWCKGFAVGSYHVDTPKALKALADMLKSVRPQPSTQAARIAALEGENASLRDTVAFVRLWVSRDQYATGPTAITNAERVSVIKHYPGIKDALTQTGGS